MTRLNMSPTDRWISLVAVAIAAILLFFGMVKEWTAVIVGVIGFGLLVSSITGFCPLYVPLKINTYRRQ